MLISSVDEIADRLKKMATRPGVVLFVGAGVGVRVGMPTWGGYMQHLAEALQRFGDTLGAQLLLQRLEENDYLGAASVFKTSNRIPLGERLQILSAPFRLSIPSDLLSKLEPLYTLPFTAMITTNYDRSLHDGFAKFRHMTPMPVELDDGSIRNAALRSDYFIARIHGRAEMPQTMIVDTTDYTLLHRNPDYLDFLLALLTQRSCVFVGFSFLDPAISEILKIYQYKAGPNYPRLHTALLPDSAAGSLGTNLHTLNIETLYYDSTDAHRNLWRAFRKAAPASGSTSLVSRPSPVSRHIRSSFHRFFAFGYAQLKSRDIQKPLMEVVVDGILLSVLEMSQQDGLSLEELVTAVREALHLDIYQAEEISRISLARLVTQGQVAESEGKLTRLGSGAQIYGDHLRKLAQSVLNRMRVREGVKTVTLELAAAEAVLEGLFIARAWDVAAHYAGAATGYSSDLPEVISRLVREQSKKQSLASPGAMERAVRDLIVSPDDDEALLLTELGRTAFAVQLVLSSPRQALLQRYALPQRVYLDASILLPLIVEGHPLRPAYADTFTRLREAAVNTGNPFGLVVGTEFLNEVVAHRSLAAGEIYDLGLEDPERLERHVQLYGATNVNVYVAGYSTIVKLEKKAVRFTEYLTRYAPYTSEAELATHLQRYGFITEEMDYRDQNNSLFIDTFNPLLEGYENLRWELIRSKERVLVEHEAQQMTRLRLDLQNGMRTLFVTADQKLQRVLQRDPRLHDLVGTTLSQVGLIALVDFMVGLTADTRSIARVMWGLARTEAQQAIRDFLIRRALEHYDVAMIMPMQEVVDNVAQTALLQSERENIDLFRSADSADAARTAAFMDRVEKGFYEYMREAMERQEQRK